MTEPLDLARANVLVRDEPELREVRAVGRFHQRAFRSHSPAGVGKILGRLRLLEDVSDHAPPLVGIHGARDCVVS